VPDPVSVALPVAAPPRRRLRLPAPFLRCAVSSLVAVAIEFLLMTLFVSVFHLHFLVGWLLATGGYLALNFVLNRHWSFRAGHAPVGGQLARHAFAVALGVTQGTALLWFFDHTDHLPYQLGWAFSGCIVFGTSTYPLNRWNFRKTR